MSELRAQKATLWFSSTLTVMAGATIAPSIPQMERVYQDLPQAALWVGLILTLPGLFIAGGSMVVGPIIDRRGRLRTLYLGLALYALAGTSGLYLSHIGLMLLGRALLGIAVAMVMTVTVTLAGDYFQGTAQKKFVGVQGVFMSVGGVIFVLVGGFLADVGWRAPFALYSASLIILLLAVRYLPEPIRPKNVNQGLANSSFTWVHTVLYVSAILSIILFYTVPLQVPYLVKELGITENKYGGIAISLVMLGSSLTGLFYSKLRGFLSAPTLLGLSFLVMGFGYVFVPYVSTYGALLGAIFISGLAAGLLMPNLSNWILEISPAHIRGKAVGLLTSMIFLGQFLNPFVSNPLKAAYGLGDTFLYIGTVGMALSLVLFFGRKRLQASED